MTHHKDMEDPQHGEILPPELYEAWWADCMDYKGNLTSGCDVAELNADSFKRGMARSYELLKPFMKAALPHYEAGLRDTRVVQADVGKLAELAAYQELVNYGN